MTGVAAPGGVVPEFEEAGEFVLAVVAHEDVMDTGGWCWLGCPTM